MTLFQYPELRVKSLSRKNPAGFSKKTRVKTVFHASNAAMIAAGFVSGSGAANARPNPFKTFSRSEKNNQKTRPGTDPSDGFKIFEILHAGDLAGS